MTDTGPEDMDNDTGDTASILAEQIEVDEPDYIRAPQPEDAFDQLIRVIQNVATDVWCEIRFSNLIWNAIGSPAANTFIAWLADEWGRWEQGWDDPKEYLDHLAKNEEYGAWLLPELRGLARNIDPAGGAHATKGYPRYRAAYSRPHGRR